MKTIKHLLLFTLLGVLFVACEAEDVMFEETESVINIKLITSDVEESNILHEEGLQDRSEDEDDVIPPEGRNSEDEDDVLPPEGKDSEDEDDVLPPERRDSEDDVPDPESD